MALRDRLRDLLRVVPRPGRVERPARDRAPEPAAPARPVAAILAPRGVENPGNAVIVDLDEVGLGALSGMAVPYVVVTATEPWRAAVGAERLAALGVRADWLEPSP